MLGHSKSARVWLPLLLAAGLVALSASSVDAGIIITAATRGVTVAATGPGGGPVGGSDSSAAGGGYIHSLSVSPGSSVGTIHSAASQSSGIPFVSGVGMGGIGSADTFDSATGEGGYSNLADSFFDVFFTVDWTGLYFLDAEVTWSGDTPPFGGVAVVKLSNITSAITIDTVKSTPPIPGTHSLHDAYYLTTGVAYRLEAQARIDGGGGLLGEFDAHASYSFTFVPEPSALGLLAPLGLTWASMVAMRR